MHKMNYELLKKCTFSDNTPLKGVIVFFTTLIIFLILWSGNSNEFSNYTLHTNFWDAVTAVPSAMD